MKLEINFAELFSSVRRMGITELVPFRVDFNSKPPEIKVDGLSTTGGIEVPIDDVDITNGVFTYLGQHVVLFIPDHSFKYDKVILDPKNEGNKYHLTDCKTLEDMRKKGRFARYHATNNREGIFHIVGSEGQETDVELSVCKNCLTQLNYQNYSQNRSSVFNRFTLDEFFKYYETYFRKMPDRNGQDKAGYSADWQSISSNYRESVNFKCEECGVNLNNHRSLLDVHHKDGVKQHNNRNNLKAVCKLCHRNEPHHEHMRVSLEDTNLLNRLRYEQGVRFY
ncbi:hypothetical protein A1D22_04620 [Pasteurellaceae bacterium LFhippo2]|nr:hypothetical protein [Pasteurellaceae bacterium LFhippo2]